MAEIGVEGEELHQTHRNQYEQTQAIISIKGLKGHASANNKLKNQTSEMLRQYLARYQTPYPFPQPQVMSEMWRRASARTYCLTIGKTTAILQEL
jgi:hypothetical protein